MARLRLSPHVPVVDPAGEVPQKVEERAVRELAAQHGDDGTLIFLADSTLRSPHF
ncbi:MAG: hypothetical protein ACLQHS_01025 [Candidatus Limnocylindrales bacterium]